MESTNINTKTGYALRREARDRLKGNWGTAILICIISFIIRMVLASILSYTLSASTGIKNDFSSESSSLSWSLLSTISSFLLSLILAPLFLGLIMCFMNLLRNEPFEIEMLFDGYKRFIDAALLQLRIFIFIFLWFFALIIPAFIAMLRYSMSFYILNDNAHMNAEEALNASKEMMKGNKMKLFSLWISFAGWFFLSLLTCGIGFIWLVPYYRTSKAAFYQNLKLQQGLDNKNQIIDIKDQITDIKE